MVIDAHECIVLNLRKETQMDWNKLIQTKEINSAKVEIEKYDVDDIQEIDVDLNPKGISHPQYLQVQEYFNTIFGSLPEPFSKFKLKRIKKSEDEKLLYAHIEICVGEEIEDDE